MRSPDGPPRDGAPRLGERTLARGVNATWWYTASGVLVLGLVSLLQWLMWMLVLVDDVVVPAWRVWVAVVAVIIALGGVTLALLDYRPNALAAHTGERVRVRARDLLSIGVILAAAALLGVAVGSWLAVAAVVGYGVSVRGWPQGIRWKVMLATTVVLVALAFAESSSWTVAVLDGGVFLVPAVFAVILPVTCVSSLWWWDIVLELDRAREAESQLSATRERLRLANDVHDLQGHHLQVIALQLELAERLMERDPEAAAREIARARSSVDDARQGTRDLAARFRGVPLPDELENAADLLRSAGLDVRSRVAAEVVEAPADVLGPIVRESVTNVLKHGDGGWVHLSIEQVADRWVYRIANEDTDLDDAGWGSGLAGMTQRAEAVGGDMQVRREAGVFELTVSLPATEAASSDENVQEPA